MRLALTALVCSAVIIAVPVSDAALQARQFAPKQASGAPPPTAAEPEKNANVVKLPIYAGASDKRVRVSNVKVVYADNKQEFLPNDPNWAQITLSFENISNSMVSLDSVKVKQNSGVLLSSANNSTQLAKAPDIMAETGKASGIMAAGNVAGAFIFPPLALLSSAFAMFGLGNSTKKWSKRMETIDNSALNTGVIPPQSMNTGNIYLPAVPDQKELVFIYSVNRNVNQLVVPVSGYQEVTLKGKKKK